MNASDVFIFLDGRLENLRENLNHVLPELKKYFASVDIHRVVFYEHNNRDPDLVFDAAAEIWRVGGMQPDDPLTANGDIADKLFSITGLEFCVIPQLFKLMNSLLHAANLSRAL